jgi:ArsR family transcriptional regulator
MNKQQPSRKKVGSRRGRRVGSTLSARFFKALCDPNRAALLARLVECCKPCTVSEIARCCPTDISVVSRHLGLLREAGIVTGERKGREVYYSVRYSELVDTLRTMADAIEACCPTPTASRKGQSK